MKAIFVTGIGLWGLALPAYPEKTGPLAGDSKMERCALVKCPVVSHRDAGARTFEERECQATQKGTAFRVSLTGLLHFQGVSGVRMAVKKASGEPVVAEALATEFPRVGEVYVSDLNGDGKEDFAVTAYRAGNGLAGAFQWGIALSSATGYSVVTLDTRDAGPEDFVRIDGQCRLAMASLTDGPPEILKAEKPHRSWLSRLLSKARGKIFPKR